MESFGIALLRTKSLSRNALIVAVAIQQMADANGYIKGNFDSVRSHCYSAFSTKVSKQEVAAAVTELIEKGVLLEDGRARPIDNADTSSGTKEGEIEEKFGDVVHGNINDGQPDFLFNDDRHHRLYGALRAVNMAPALYDVKDDFLRDQHGRAVLVDGRRRPIKRFVWSYSLASKLLKKHGVDILIRRCLDINSMAQKRGAAPKLDADDPNIKETLKRFRKYFLGVVGHVPDFEDEDGIDEVISVVVENDYEIV